VVAIQQGSYHSGQLFVNTANGDVEPGVIAQTYTFTPGVAIGFAPGQYLPALVASPPNSADVCPAVSACTESAYAVYQSSIQCYDATPYQCGLNATSWDNTVIPGGAAGPTQLGVECLTQHPEGTPSDFLDASLWPAGPMQIKPQSGPQTSADVSTSSSVVTFPIIDDSLPINANGGPVTVIGFMQAFIQPTSANGSLIVVVLNIAGCSDTPSGAPSPIIGGMGTSPVAVRLITWP
jgi:hypothetical protein